MEVSNKNPSTNAGPNTKTKGSRPSDTINE